MKTIILAGGWGTRLGQHTEWIPKPMVQIGDRPMLWHIMKVYAHYGFRDFIVSTGVKTHIIKEYFLKYRPLKRNFPVFPFYFMTPNKDLKNKLEILENWYPTILDGDSSF